MRAPNAISEDELELEGAEVETAKPEIEAGEDSATELDVLGQYLKETHRYPLLNREQEQLVSRAMRRSEAELKSSGKKKGATRKAVRTWSAW